MNSFEEEAVKRVQESDRLFKMVEGGTGCEEVLRYKITHLRQTAMVYALLAQRRD